MKFDVIIGNPPYQMSTTEIQGKANAIPIYQKFVLNALKWKPSLLSMIIPARWMASDMSELSKFRDEIIHSNQIRVLHDFMDSKSCFPGVDVKGGICYFLHDSGYIGECQIFSHTSEGIKESRRFMSEGGENIYVRDSILHNIKNKAMTNNSGVVMDIASPQTPYKILTNAFKSSGEGKGDFKSERVSPSDVRVLGNGDHQRRAYRFIDRDYAGYVKYKGLDKYKVFVPEAYGCGAIGEVPSTPVLGTPGDACTQTFIQLGFFDTREEAENLLSYIKTKFFRTLVGIMKQTQHANRGVYRYVPLQDFSKPWTDEELYKKYNLSDEEIAFIEENIAPMGDN